VFSSNVVAVNSGADNRVVIGIMLPLEVSECLCSCPKAALVEFTVILVQLESMRKYIGHVIDMKWLS